MCRCILCIVSRLIKIYGEYIYEQAKTERSQNSCFVYERGDSVFCEKEDGERKSRAAFLTLFMKVDRHFMTKCFGQMQELGIYPGQIPVLGLVAKKDGLSQRELAKILNIKPPTVNVSVQRLEKAGFFIKSRMKRPACDQDLPDRKRKKRPRQRHWSGSIKMKQ